LKKKKSLSKEILSWLKAFVIAIIIVILCRNYLFTSTTVYGESMEPTFSEHDRIIIGKQTKISRFDIVVFQSPNSEEYFIKRVIGLPGDHIEMKDDVLYINGKKYHEPYLKEENELSIRNMIGDFTLQELTGEPVVPEETLFVLGDNRLNSYDSRFFGFIPNDSVIGEVKFRYFPLDKIGIPD
jgi:signal peptidase I